MVQVQKIDMDWDGKNGVKYWVKGEVTLEPSDLTLNEVEVTELCRYETNDDGSFKEVPIELEDLDIEARGMLYNKMAEKAITDAGEEGI